MTRRSSHCNSNGHNTRNYSTKGGGGPRPFGVRLTDGPVIKKSASVGSLLHYSVAADSTEEYHSDDPDHGSASRRMRKKEIPWTEEEHRNFLLGLNNLGKGDWRGISKVYVPSRTPSQVASHAQKYYVCQISANRKKKRTSLFDKVPSMEANSSVSEPSSIPPPVAHTDNEKLVPSTVQETNRSHLLPSPDLSLKAAVLPLPFQLRPQDACSLKEDGAGSLSHQQIPRSVPVVPEEPVKELEKMSHLSLGPPALSLGLPSNP